MVNHGLARSVSELARANREKAKSKDEKCQILKTIELIQCEINKNTEVVCVDSKIWDGESSYSWKDFV